MRDKIKVSVLCLAYNHEKYIRKCLDSILNQKTQFEFNIIVNDDASTDSTATILHEYQKKYSDKMICVYQKENQYSKGVDIVEDILLNYTDSEYIALCECDDFWTDNNKLQLQFEYMQEHSECALCTHNTIIHDLNGNSKDTLFNTWKNVHILSAREVFMMWKVHTSSFFMRRELGYRPKNYRKYWFGDYVRLVVAFGEGNIAVLPFVMSVYNYGVPTGLLQNVDKDMIESRKKRILERKEFLEQLDQEKYNKYLSIIEERMYLTELEAETLIDVEILRHTDVKSKKIERANKIFKSREFRNYLSSLKGIRKVKEIFKYKGYFLYPVWKKIWN